MGGFNSGGGRDAPREDHFLRLDLATLKRLNMLRPYWSQSLIWTRGGHECGRIGVESHPDHLILAYKTRAPGEEWREMRERIALSFTTPHYGGRRAWMLCPGCGARKRTLWGSRRFLCRACHGGVTYDSQYEDAPTRTLSEIQKMRKKLGGEISLDHPFPDRPKRMRQRTYARLIMKEARLQEKLARQMKEKFGWTF